MQAISVSKVYEWLTHMLNSMTGFAARTGAHANWKWVWDLRSVNARGLDVRLRVPDWIDGLEVALRDRLRKDIGRGSVTLNLRLTRDAGNANQSGALSVAAIDAALQTIAQVEQRSREAHDVHLAPTTAADIVQMVRRDANDDEMTPEEMAKLKAALTKDFGALMAEFQSSRKAEGAKLQEVLLAQVAQIEELTHACQNITQERSDGMARTFRDALDRIAQNADGLNQDRINQEIATMAVKADVAEELDRLKVHVTAARDLIAANGPVGRKLDFLTQEFNREANTLCSKSQWQDLTAVGLDLKAVVDQMREQVQNVV